MRPASVRRSRALRVCSGRVGSGFRRVGETHRSSSPARCSVGGFHSPYNRQTGLPEQTLTECAVKRQCQLSRCKSRPANSVAPTGSDRSGGGGNEAVGALETSVPPRRCIESIGRNASECRTGLERLNAGADPPLLRGRPSSLANRETGGIGRPSPCSPWTPSPRRPPTRTLIGSGRSGPPPIRWCHATFILARKGSAPWVLEGDIKSCSTKSESVPEGI
jgi:hypothetical protein